jgi:hypothetical protein
MRTIIAGSRDVDDYELLQRVIQESGIPITVVLTGRAKGVDKLGERWAFENDIPVECYPIKKYENESIRDRKMVEHGDVMIAVTRKGDGNIPIIDSARKKGIECHIHEVD